MKPRSRMPLPTGSVLALLGVLAGGCTTAPESAVVDWPAIEVALHQAGIDLAHATVRVGSPAWRWTRAATDLPPIVRIVPIEIRSEAGATRTLHVRVDGTRVDLIDPALLVPEPARPRLQS